MVVHALLPGEVLLPNLGTERWSVSHWGHWGLRGREGEQGEGEQGEGEQGEGEGAPLHEGWGGGRGREPFKPQTRPRRLNLGLIWAPEPLPSLPARPHWRFWVPKAPHDFWTLMDCCPGPLEGSGGGPRSLHWRGHEPLGSYHYIR